MSVSGQVARDLLRVYDHSLEQQIMQRGSSLACRDEKLWMQVEGLLRDGDAPEKHCLGLDALVVMEESLQAASLCSSSVRTRGELHGLAKAFEVLEQAALNLYLGPWRKEYRVIKMYSGTFTHCIAPVLSMPQTEKLFGMLGYRPSPARAQQLCLHSARVSPSVLEDLLRLSCAFFVARCECHLLLSALGTHVGDAQWELNVVRERLRGSSLQVAVDNTKKRLETSRPAAAPADGEMDLYCEEQHKADEVAAESNTASAGLPAVDSQQIAVPWDSKDKPEPKRSCTCLRSPLCLKHCLQCSAVHDITCAFLGNCEAEGHDVLSLLGLMEDKMGLMEELPVSGQVPASSLCPIGFHDCCDLSDLDPRVLCRQCRVFHSASCDKWTRCRAEHEVGHLGVCSCGKVCSRNPLVLCRYCGTEFCSNCWYKNPITCTCGQTLVQSSSV